MEDWILILIHSCYEKY